MDSAFCFNLHGLTLYADPSFALFLIEEEREDPPESRQGFEITLARTTGLVSLVKLVFRARASIY